MKCATPSAFLFALLCACSGSGDKDTGPLCDTSDRDTSDTGLNPCGSSGGGGGGGGGGGETDTDTTPIPAGMMADISVSNGDSKTFTAGSVFGESDETRFGFTGLGTDPTNSLAIGIASGSGLGTYAVSANTGDSPATYTDFQWGYENGGFVSLSGTVTVTGWEATSGPGGVPAHAATGTFLLQLTNSPEGEDPAALPLNMEVSGTFGSIVLLDAG